MATFSPTFEKVIHCDFLRAIGKLQKLNISQARLILKSPSSEERGLKLKTLEEVYHGRKYRAADRPWRVGRRPLTCGGV